MLEIANRNFGNQWNMSQPIDPIAFGRRVKEKREELGLTHVTLGKKAGFSRSNIGWIESGDGKDPRKQVLKLAEPLRTTPDWLLYGKGVRDVAPPPLSADELALNYEKFPLEDRDAITALASEIIARLSKKRSKQP